MSITNKRRYLKGREGMKYKPLPIGIDDFEELITRGAYYVDKTRLIKKLIDNTTKVTLFTRPRRFGKSLNLSMLQAYFENDGVDRAHLFEGFKIADTGEVYQKELGRYPVVTLNFKDGKWPTFAQSYEMIRYNIAREFDRHMKILQSEMLDEVEKSEFRRIRSGNADINDYSQSIAFLCACLEKVYGEKVIILIDEYDVPLENAYFRGFYDEMSSFIRGTLSLALKTNKSLAFAVITGCLRITKESIFTGYLKRVDQRIDEEQVVLTLEIPNLEVKSVYRRQIMEWVKEQIEQKDMKSLYEATLSGDVQAIEVEMKRAMVETISYYDYNESLLYQVYVKAN